MVHVAPKTIEPKQSKFSYCELLLLTLNAHQTHKHYHKITNMNFTLVFFWVNSWKTNQPKLGYMCAFGSNFRGFEQFYSNVDFFSTCGY